jgi:hypothetical protein
MNAGVRLTLSIDHRWATNKIAWAAPIMRSWPSNWKASAYPHLSPPLTFNDHALNELPRSCRCDEIELRDVALPRSCPQKIHIDDEAMCQQGARQEVLERAPAARRAER